MNDKQREEIEQKIQESINRINASFERSNKRWEQDRKERDAIYDSLTSITAGIESNLKCGFAGKVEDFHTLTKKGVKDEQR